MDRPLKPDEVKKHIGSIIARVRANPPFITARERSKLIFVVRGHMAAICDNDETRRKVMGFVLGRNAISTGGLSDAELIALKRWVGPKLIDNTWVTRENFEQEFMWCIWAERSGIDLDKISSPVIQEVENLGGVVVAISTENPLQDDNNIYTFD